MQIYDKKIGIWRTIDTKLFHGYPPAGYKQKRKIPIDLITELILQNNDVEKKGSIKTNNVYKKEECKMESCAICLRKLFDDESSLRKLESCNHLFHNFCLHHCDVDFYSICPLCKIPLISEDLKHCLMENENIIALTNATRTKNHKKKK